MGNINISIARTKAYANEQRTMNNERYPKQTQSNPILPPSGRFPKPPKPPFFLDFPCAFCYQQAYRPAALAAYSYVRSLERCDYTSA